jgi:hypothetical protein
LFLTHGSSTDPGVQFQISKADKSLSDLMPTPAERASARRWNASHFQSSQLINAPVSTTDLDNPTLPSLVVQITTFTCYGLCIGVKFAHPLSDAHCMSLFVKDWADISRAMLSVNPLPAPSPFFEPQLLDRCADGDIDASSADLALLEKAKSLPMHRYDWWISGEGCPYETHSKHISPELKEIAAAGTEPSGTKIPWAEWELQKPTAHYVLHFTHEELKNMKQAMVATVKGVSIHDALLAHIWSCANRARGLDSDDQPVHLDYTLGLRNRVSPPLPTRFVGSCHLIAAVSCTGREASSDPAKLASLIRNTVAVFTPDKIAAHLHSKIYEQNPNRFWEGFLGRRHMMPTSWVRTGLNAIDFGTGFARYVEAVLPPCDGLLHIMEAIPTSTDTPGLPLKHWAEHGVDVHFYMEAESMQRILDDSFLRAYDSND